MDALAYSTQWLAQTSAQGWVLHYLSFVLLAAGASVLVLTTYNIPRK